jgi:IS605 OrfB family transposase
LNKDIIVGVDLGFTCPLYAAVSNGHDRLGWNDFASLAHRIKSLQTQVMSRRRQIQRGGRSKLVADTARSGHGRARHLLPIGPLEGRINDAYSTLNHQLSKAVVEFAKRNGAGVIQIEDLTGLKDSLSGTFIGERWRYHQLQSQLAYKAEEAGIELRTINPKFTSRRCSQCGHIHFAFDRAFRAKCNKFECPACGHEENPDYNAAKNLTLPDIEERVNLQLRLQGIEIATAIEGQPACPES